MIKKHLSLFRVAVIAISMLIGFLGGVVFTVYKSPSILSQVPNSQQQASNKEETLRHLKHLEKNIAENPADIDSWTQLTHTYYDLEDYPKAIQAYLKLIDLSDEKSIIYTDLGVVYRRDAQHKKAIESFEKALEHNKANVQAQFNIGVVLYHDLDDEQGAIQAWEKVALLQPDFQLSTGQTIKQLLEKLK
jgi:cytochrome c-type biogenesis protein CcmH/NrfG